MHKTAAPIPVPDFEVHVSPPDLSPWIAGNTGVPGFTTRESGKPGPHVALLGLTHGNELAGGIVLDRLLRAGLVPVRGRLSFGFVNLVGLERFDPRRPTASRFVDEDLNRIWDEDVLDGPRHSIELDRAREIRPFIDTVDVLLDMHSMLWPSDPLILCGETEKGRQLACGIGTPALVVADVGHANGRRLLDYSRFSSADTPYVANLVEAGQHWEPETIDNAMASVAGLLRHLGVAAADAPMPVFSSGPQRCADVTTAITASTTRFAFVQSYRGGDVIPERGTLIAMDGHKEVRTPYDDCLLIMPSLRASRGHTAVRLAKFR